MSTALSWSARLPVPHSGTRPSATVWRGLALAAAAFALYAGLAQDAFYRSDGHAALIAVYQGDWTDGRHPWYRPILLLLTHVLTPMGLSPFEAVRLASALGTALAVFVWHQAAARWMGPGRTAAIVGSSVLCAVAPANVFFATVPEVHGVFLPFAAVAWWGGVRCAHAPTRARFAALGAATAMATQAHATGHFLLPVILAWVVAGRERKTPRLPVSRLGTAVAAHALLWTALTLAFIAAGGQNPPATQLGFVDHHLELIRVTTDRSSCAAHLEGLAQCLLHDWLWPYLPVSLALLLTLSRQRAHRSPAVVLTAAVALYVGLTWALVAGDERGAYLAPLVWPAAIGLAAHLRQRWIWTAALLGTGLAWHGVAEHDRPGGSPAYVTDLRAATTGERPLVLTAHPYEAEWLLRDAYDLWLRELNGWRRLTPDRLRQSCPQILDRLHQLSQTRDLYLGGLTALELKEGPTPQGYLLWAQLESAFDMTLVTRRTFVAMRLETRQTDPTRKTTPP
ncbi:MAG: hypothetical protein AAF628_09860 [Planctomycetota bacterium]